MLTRHTVPIRHTVIVAMLAVVALIGLPTPGAGAASGDPAWGALSSACDAARLSSSAGAGLTVVEVDAAWDRYLPQKAGVVDTAYVTTLRTQVTRCLDAGFRVVLGSGTQYPPSWVAALSGAAYKDQRGKAPSTRAVDVVFSSAVRAAQADYLKRLVTDLPSGRLDGIRVGTSTAGEIGYPGPNEAGDGFLQSWWAFGVAPQQGTGLAGGMTRSPLPGWVPGQKTWNGRAVTATDATNWFRWYEQALVGSWKFQVTTLRTAGYPGAVHFPSPGKGVLPTDLTTATGALLNGSGDRDGSLGRGLFYVDQFTLAANGIGGNLVIDLTSVDDATSVSARTANPPQDVCQTSDASLSQDTSTPVATWSNLRFARAQVARANLSAVGENPGPPAASTGGVSGSDTELEQVRRSPAYARSCGMAAFLLGFEDDLYTGRSGVTLDDYRASIAGSVS